MAIINVRWWEIFFGSTKAGVQKWRTFFVWGGGGGGGNPIFSDADFGNSKGDRKKSA